MLNFRPSRVILMLGLCAAMLGGCQTVPRAGGADYDPNLIGPEELADLNVSTAHDAVQRLRPRWFQSQRSSPSSLHSGTRVVTFLNKTNLGGFEMLKQISLSGVHSLEFLGNSEAVARLPGLGSGHVGAAIVVHTYDGQQ